MVREKGRCSLCCWNGDEVYLKERIFPHRFRSGRAGINVKRCLRREVTSCVGLQGSSPLSARDGSFSNGSKEGGGSFPSWNYVKEIS